MIAKYCGALLEAWQASGIFGYLLVATWLMFPVAVTTLYHPSDAVGFQLWLEGFAVPRMMTHAALNAGFGAALLALGVLALAQFNLIVFIYRRAGFPVQLWPLALFLVGFIANGLWWVKTGYFDPSGAMAGLSPALATIAVHGILERASSDFVWGPNKPQYDGGY